MIEEFTMKLDDGREIRVTGELLEAEIPPHTVEELVKSATFAELVVKMSEQLTSMGTNSK